MSNENDSRLEDQNDDKETNEDTACNNSQNEDKLANDKDEAVKAMIIWIWSGECPGARKAREKW